MIATGKTSGLMLARQEAIVYALVVVVVELGDQAVCS
jgi:hypothetical protein